MKRSISFNNSNLDDNFSMRVQSDNTKTNFLQIKLICKFFVFVVLSILIVSCEKEISFSEKDINPKLVINGFIQKDSLIKIEVSVSKAIPGVQTSFQWLDDASVTLFVDGVEKEKLTTYNLVVDTINNYYYYQVSKAKIGYTSTNTIAEAGKTYRLEVSHPKYKTAYSETTVPYPIVIEKLDTLTDVVNHSNGYYSTNFKVKATFTDQKGKDNYYRLIYKLKRGSPYYSYPDTGQAMPILIQDEVFGTYISSDDIVLNPNEEDPNDFLFGSPSNRYNIFNDERFDGKTYTLSFFVDQYSFSDYLYSKVKGSFYVLDIEIQSITRETYLYLKSLASYSYYEGDPFAEPVQVFTNVENGVGVFGSYSSSNYLLKKGEYPVEGVEYIENNRGIYY